MWIAELWRYPVKSMAGEPLQRAELGRDGIIGDRLVQVRDNGGRVITSRTRPRLLGHRAILGPDGEPLVDGRPWSSDAVARDVEAAAGPGARLVRHAGLERFDVLPLLVATDGAIEAFGYDRRRLRPNLVVGGVKGLAEREWEGRLLRAGGAILGVRDLRARCVMTTFDPSTLEQDVDVLRRIQEKFDGRLALNCSVVGAATIAVGDRVDLIAPS
ncbi:MAG TPA: MOSC N-terminal beta barrel domain-containing protein [Candidatus Polarisedimenticolia bacterium]|nr:MOSC N-terminal beta barrel domain-containing protein [Candidatus Polarisedimenticolia bacterium]